MLVVDYKSLDYGVSRLNLMALTPPIREEKKYQMIEDEILGNLFPVKPDRSFDRKNHSSTKFPVSKKASF